MTLEKIISKFFNQDKNNLVLICVFVSFLSLGVSLFSIYQIKNISYRPSTGEVVLVNPEKILGEIPKNAAYLGNPNAKVTLIEFADFQCPFCGRFSSQIFPDIKKEYIDTGKIKFIYIDFTFLGQESKKSAEAAKCAGEQGKFWQYHDELFNNQLGENQGAFNQSNLKKFAKNVGVDLDLFERCTISGKYDQLIDEENALTKRYGITGTPSFIAGKQVIKGISSIENFRQVIDSQLK